MKQRTPEVVEAINGNIFVWNRIKFTYSLTDIYLPKV